MMKPIDVHRLLEHIGQLLRIQWQQTREGQPDVVLPPLGGARPSMNDVEELRDLAQIGHVKAIQRKLDRLDADHPELAAFVARMRTLVERFDFKQYLETLRTFELHDK